MKAQENNIKIIRVSEAKKKYLVVTSDGDYTFSEDTIIKYLVFQDKVFSKKEFSEIIDFEETNILFSKALNFLSYGFRSEKEIERYLAEKKAKVTQIKEIITRLKKLNYIDDEALANNMLDYCYRTLKGPNVLSQKLFQKGISENLIKKTINSYTLEKQEEVIDIIITKFIEKESNLPIRMQKTKLMKKLITSGFEMSIIMEKTKQNIFTNNSKDLLEKEYKTAVNKYRNIENEYERKTKIVNYLLRKGYEYSEINQILTIEE